MIKTLKTMRGKYLRALIILIISTCYVACGGNGSNLKSQDDFDYGDGDGAPSDFADSDLTQDRDEKSDGDFDKGAEENRDDDQENRDDGQENRDDGQENRDDGQENRDDDQENRDDDQENRDDGQENPDFDSDGSNFDSSTIKWMDKKATVKVVGDSLRTYTITTTADLRDNVPESKERIVSEIAGNMLLRSKNKMVDALFATALAELQEDSVAAISDYSFNNGEPVDCDCFETGEKWRYVWTRDTAYAVNLGIGFVDPERSLNSLNFKISEKKGSVGGGDMQIIQDTGSGGSWPVSSDRVVWALGAIEVLKYYSGDKYLNFLNNSYKALVNTIENDRLYIYDGSDGLYFGEQSFLDWREQSYPLWTANDVVHIATSKTLSTNVLHYIILDLTSKIASELKSDAATAAKYENWKNSLAKAIKNNFYISDKKTLSSMKTTFLDPSAVEKRDLLGQSLAVIYGLLDETQLSEIVASYPTTKAGPPVIWPQEPKRRIYHNRAIWPFVTAYALKAAVAVENDKVYENAFMSLINGAALNLSNMENLEFTTLSAWYEDTRKDFQNHDLSGPVVNSRRQLWSVGGFISLVLEGMFGMSGDFDSVTFNPKMAVNLRNRLFPDSSEISLKDFSYKNKKMGIKLILPPKNEKTQGFLIVNSSKLNGEAHSKTYKYKELKTGDKIEIELKYSNKSSSINLVDCSNEADCFAPVEPEISNDASNFGVTVKNGRLQVAFSSEGDGLTFNIFRDGTKVASGVTSSPWIDENSADYLTKSYCYSVSAINGAGLESHRANPVCYWGTNFERANDNRIEANEFDQTPNATDHSRIHFSDWGTPEAELSVSSFSPTKSGVYLVQIEYGSGRPIDSGITASTKLLEIIDNFDNSTVAKGAIVMPHLGDGDWERWGNSSFLKTTLYKNKNYKIKISDLFNMSYFKHFELYTGNIGGGSEVYNRVNLSTVKFLLIESLD